MTRWHKCHVPDLTQLVCRVPEDTGSLAGTLNGTMHLMLFFPAPAETFPSCQAAVTHLSERGSSLSGASRLPASVGKGLGKPFSFFLSGLFLKLGEQAVLCR